MHYLTKTYALRDAVSHDFAVSRGQPCVPKAKQYRGKLLVQSAARRRATAFEADRRCSNLTAKTHAGNSIGRGAEGG